MAYGLAFAGAAVACAAIAALVAASFATGSDALPEGQGVLYAGVAAAESPRPTRTPPGSTVAPRPKTTSATPPPLTPTPAPTVLAAVVTPIPMEAPAETTHAVAGPPCPQYPILLDPAPDLLAATEGATLMWSSYVGCTVFEIADGGIPVRYEPAWPGVCAEVDIAACTMNGIFLSPLEPLYDPQSVIAHELGHVLNLGHGEGPGVMDPGRWDGALTIWCDLDTRCR